MEGVQRFFELPGGERVVANAGERFRPVFGSWRSAHPARGERRFVVTLGSVVGRGQVKANLGVVWLRGLRLDELFDRQGRVAAA